jgi:sugar lactone lactonase YvrE
MAARMSFVVLALLALVVSRANAAHPTLVEPFDVMPSLHGHLLVSDRAAGVVYDLDPATGNGSAVANVPQARELARLPDGRLLVTSDDRVLVVSAGSHATRVFARAEASILGLAVAGDGSLFVSENVPGSDDTTVVRLRGRTRTVLVSGLRGVHGILVVRHGLVLSEAYGGRVLALDLRTRRLRVLAHGLGNPSFTLPAPGGGYYVSEFTGNRVSRVSPDGHVQVVAAVSQPGPIAFDDRGRIVGVTIDGTIFRIERRHAHTIYR